MARWREQARRRAGDAVQWAWDRVCDVGTIRPGTTRARRFLAFGEASAICFPVAALFGEEYIAIGRGTIVGPSCTLSAGILPGHAGGVVPSLRLGDRCLLGRGSAIVAHESIELADDVFTGHGVYITDASHGYDEPRVPIGRQFGVAKPVRVGEGSWLGHGVVVLPGADIAEHVTVGAGSVVTGPLPPFSVAVGSPARVIRRMAPDEGWVREPPRP